MSIPKMPIKSNESYHVTGWVNFLFDGDGNSIDLTADIASDLTEFYEMKKMQSECDHKPNNKNDEYCLWYHERCPKCGAKL